MVLALKTTLVLFVDLEQHAKKLTCDDDCFLEIWRLGYSLAWLCMDTRRWHACIECEESGVIVTHDIQEEEIQVSK